MAEGLSRGLLIDTGIEGEITDIPPARGGTPHPVRVDFSYDENGVVLVKASLPGLQHTVDITYQQTGARMDAEAFARAQQQVDAFYEEVEEAMEELSDVLEGEDADERYWEPVMLRAARMAEEYPRQRKALQKALTDLRKALPLHDSVRTEKAGNRLADLMSDIESGV